LNLHGVSRDVACPVCKVGPRENCRNTETGGDMGRMCHFARWTALLVTQGKARYVS